MTCFFGKSDPAVIDEWLQNVRRDPPKWIVYNALEEEFTGKTMDYFQYTFCRQRNSEIEKILDEKYSLADELSRGYLLKLYRLREK